MTRRFSHENSSLLSRHSFSIQLRDHHRAKTKFSRDSNPPQINDDTCARARQIRPPPALAPTVDKSAITPLSFSATQKPGTTINSKSNNSTNTRTNTIVPILPAPPLRATRTHASRQKVHQHPSTIPPFSSLTRHHPATRICRELPSPKSWPKTLYRHCRATSSVLKPNPYFPTINNPRPSSGHNLAVHNPRDRQKLTKHQFSFNMKYHNIYEF